MKDLIEELLEALEPYDVHLHHFAEIRRHLRTLDTNFTETRLSTERSLRAFINDQTRALRERHGHDASDKALEELVGLNATLIMAGKLTGNPLTDMIIVYAAHISALTSYGLSPWTNVSKIVLAAQMSTTEKELARSRR